MEWYPRYPSLWRAKTMHIDPFQDGCYLRLVDHYMETRQPLPESDVALARIIGISVEQWHGHASGIVRAFFRHENGSLFHDRCDTILREQDERSKRHTEKSKKGAEARWRKNKEIDAAGIAQAMPPDATRQDKTGQSIPIGIDTPILPKLNGASHAKPRRKPTTFISEDFRGDFGCIALAGKHGLDVTEEERRFIDHWLAKGEARADWQASFRTWLGNSAKYRAERERRKSDGRPKAQGVVDAALRVANRYQGQG